MKEIINYHAISDNELKTLYETIQDAILLKQMEKELKEKNMKIFLLFIVKKIVAQSKFQLGLIFN